MSDEKFTRYAEPPITAQAIGRNVARAPRAAEVAIDLLRTIDFDDLERGLCQESLAYGLLQGSGEHTDWLVEHRHPPLPVGQVRLSRKDKALDIVIARPWARNAIDRDMRDVLFEAFTIASLDNEIEAVRLTAVGKAFSIGGDLSEFGTTRDPSIAHAIRMQTLPAIALLGCAHKLTAHVQGACIGAGLEIAAFANRLTATRTAWFQLPELAMGLIPGAGGCVSVTRRIGRERMIALVLSGRRLDAVTALDWGLIDAIVDDLPVDQGEADVVG